MQKDPVNKFKDLKEEHGLVSADAKPNLADQLHNHPGALQALMLGALAVC